MNQTVISENPSVCTVRKTNTQGCNMYVHYVHSSSTYIYILQFHAIKPQNLSLIFPRSFQFYSVTWRHFKHLSLVKISSACRPLYCAPQTLCSLTAAKFIFSKNATKIDEIFTIDLTFTTQCQIDGEDFVHFCGLLRKYEL